MNIYNPIPPTYLYIKQHAITGLKYFGKTTRDPYKYLGSGKHWIRHVNKHGKEFVNTIWVSEPYTNTTILTEFALFFSEEYDIVNSKVCANLIPENGLDGNTTGSKSKPETCAKISTSKIGKTNLVLSEKKKGGRWYKNIEGTHEVYICKNAKVPGLYVYGRIIDMCGDKNSRFGSQGWNKGIPMSDESKIKNSIANVGKKRTTKDRENMSIGGKTSYINGRIVNCAKSVVVNNVTYKSLRKASIDTGISLYKLRQLLRE